MPLNSAIHTAAVVQVRMCGSARRAYYERNFAAGATPRAATRCLKRHLSNRIGDTGVCSSLRDGRLSGVVFVSGETGGVWWRS